MTTVTLLAGERSIGGTQIVVEEGEARLLFDCGMPFNPGGNPFNGVRRRSGQELSDVLRLGLAPYIPGLYAPEHLACLPPDTVPALPSTEGPLAVALSHSHLDHTQLVGFVDRSVPVYASAPAGRIVRVLSDVGATLGRLARPIAAVEPGGTFDVGSMRVRMLPVDHDVGGASGLLVETSDGVIAYPGDMRLHGRHPERTLAFARAAREAGARLLILEGTRLAPSPEPGALVVPERVEADVEPAAMSALREVPGRLGVILLTPENGERVEALAQAAAGAGRLLVLDLEGLAFATAALGRPIDAPHAVYLPAETARAIETGDALPATLRAALDATPRIVTAPEIVASPGSFLLRLDLSRFADLLDLVPPGGAGVILTANGTPLGPFDPGWPAMLWWAERLGFDVVDAGSTGHAAPRDLALIAAHSGALTVMSIHSRNPELMPIPADRLLLPERGRRYDLAELA